MEGYQFAGWGGDISGDDNPMSFGFVEDLDIVLEFTEIAVPPLGKEDKGTIEVYPNPTSDRFYVLLPTDNRTELTLYMLDIEGKEVWSVQGVTADADYLEVDVTSLPSGLYFLTLRNTGDKTPLVVDSILRVMKN